MELSSENQIYSEEAHHIPDIYRERVDKARKEMRTYAEQLLYREIADNETADPVQLRKAAPKVMDVKIELYTILL